MKTKLAATPVATKKQKNPVLVIRPGQLKSVRTNKTKEIRPPSLDCNGRCTMG